MRLLVHELVSAGFRRVGVVRGGFAALPPEMVRTTLVSGSAETAEPVEAGAAGGGGAGGRAGAGGGGKGGTVVGRLGQKMAGLKERMPLFAKRAKPKPIGADGADE